LFYVLDRTHNSFILKRASTHGAFVGVFSALDYVPYADVAEPYPAIVAAVEAAADGFTASITRPIQIKWGHEPLNLFVNCLGIGKKRLSLTGGYAVSEKACSLLKNRFYV
jgi:hypothetical protein